MVSAYLERPLRSEREAVLDTLSSPRWELLPHSVRLATITRAIETGISSIEIYDLRAEAAGVSQKDARRELRMWALSFIGQPESVVDLLP